jgi:acetyl-CoA synthetase
MDGNAMQGQSERKLTYSEACGQFRWEEGLNALGWNQSPTINLGHTILDRRASDKIALYWFGKGGSAKKYSFKDLSRLTNRFANLLRSLGIRKGDRIAGYLPRIPETLIVMIGAWKAGAIYLPIFTGLGPDAIKFRVQHSKPKVFCTQWEYRARIPQGLPGVQALISVAGPKGEGLESGDVDFWKNLDEQPETFNPEECLRNEPAIILYTSGSTGQPKGAMLANNFPLAIYPYLIYGADIQPNDLFWPTGDPGWGYGLVCYMVPLAMGLSIVSHEAQPTPELCLSLLRDVPITNMATTPTLLRNIMAIGSEKIQTYPNHLRSMSSCGEPLNAEVIHFFKKNWGITIMDQYGSSEFGMPIGNFNAIEMEVKPGSMGLPLPGFTMGVVDDTGRELPKGEIGQIGLKPSLDGCYCLGYWEDPQRTRELYKGPWMTIGDLARRDQDGYFWFEGRADDVIKSAGYRIGPFEVESAILNHPAVAEAGVVGKPDSIRGEIVKAYVVLKPGKKPYPELQQEIVDVVKSRLGKYQYPREIEFLEQLPKTESGKIQRFILRSKK